jgi:FMN phosphatase YigB (HAD superfamily)
MLSNNVPVLCDRVRDDPRTARIERFVFSNEIGVRKPDPAAFMALAEALQLAPHEIVFVDDAAATSSPPARSASRRCCSTRPRLRRALARHAADLAHLVDGPGWAP